METNLVISICSLINILILSIVFFSKKRIKKFDNKIYGYLIIVVLLDLLTEMASYLLLKNGMASTSVMYILFNRLTLFWYSLWIVLFAMYMFSVIYETENIKELFNIKIVKVLVSLYFGEILVIFFGSLEFKNIGELFIPMGLSTYVVYIEAFIYDLILFGLIIIKYTSVLKKLKQILPLLVTFVLGIFISLIQFANPDIFLISSLFVITTFVMYFTIENPDVKLVEYEKTEKERAEAASLAKSEFLSSMSHELRTPLNAIVGLSEDIDSFNDKVPEEVREDTKDIINASNTLLEIIGSILDISKIESGKLDIVEENYDPREEFESVAKINRTKFAEKNLEFNVSIAENLPEVLFGDRIRIKQILNNFLSNAYKYTDGGHVDYIVNWLDASQSLQIIVKDTGRGVKPEDIDKLFAKYDRLGVEKTSNVQGTGLGLNITKTLIDLMGGTVKVDSEYMVGSTFTVVLPQKIGDKEALEALKRESERKIEKVDYSGKRLLVVDDNMLNIKVFKKAVRDYNFTIDECYNGKEALEKIEMNNNYDIVLMDIKMPIMGGEEAIKYIRAMPNFNSVIIALTADAMTGAFEKYTAMGFDDYLPKPFTRDVVSRKLTSILGDGKEEKKVIKKENLENTAVINVEHAEVTVNNYNVNNNENKE